MPKLLRPEKLAWEARPAWRPERKPVPRLRPYLMRPRLLRSLETRDGAESTEATRQHTINT